MNYKLIAMTNVVLIRDERSDISSDESHRLTKYKLTYQFQNGVKVEEILDEFLDPITGSFKHVIVANIEDYMKYNSNVMFNIIGLVPNDLQQQAYTQLFIRSRERLISRSAKHNSSFDGEPATIVYRNEGMDDTLQEFFNSLKENNTEFNFYNSEAHFIPHYMVTDSNEIGTPHLHPEHREVVVRFEGDSSSFLRIQACKDMIIDDQGGALNVSKQYNESTGLYAYDIFNTTLENKFIHIKFHSALHSFTVHPNYHVSSRSQPSIIGRESTIGFISIHSDMNTEEARVSNTINKSYKTLKHAMTYATVVLIPLYIRKIIENHMLKRKIPQEYLVDISHQQLELFVSRNT